MSKAALHADIARRYNSKHKKLEPVSLAALRVKQLQRLYAHRYGHELPNDDAGRDDAFVMVNHLARRPQPERRIPAWLSLNAPWMPPEEVQALTTKVIGKPLRWRADTLGKRLNLTEAERRHLGITTIGAVDVEKAERLARRKHGTRNRVTGLRRAAGAKPRAHYEANALTRTKPWEAMGVSRRTWYRRGRPSGTGPYAA